MNGYVKQVQNWLSQEFPDYFSETGKYPILPDGIAGQSTMNALTMALQITVDVTEIDGEWNQELSEKCPIVNAVSVPNVIRIAQGCLYCKGYYDNGFNGEFTVGTKADIESFKQDLGLSVFESVIEPDFFRSLLTLDQVRETKDTDQYIRAAQQYLNKNYYQTFSTMLSFLPTDGVYEAKTNRALIIVLQKELYSGFINYLKALPPEADGLTLYEKMFPYIKEGAVTQLTDNARGIIELPKLAAVIEAYIDNKSTVPSFWAGWGGDLASSMLATTLALPAKLDYASAFVTAFEKVGSDGVCSYSTLCADMDAVKIADIINNATEGATSTFTNALSQYYSLDVENHFANILADIPGILSYDELNTQIYHRMTGSQETADTIPGTDNPGLIPYKGNNPTMQVMAACCSALAHYVHTETA
ncbi:hypothetical protein [Eisenbergiella porci]|uniref:hypothetical protein n=2 Tax=Eisenbergiella porci TaxID=2652274 RepID=UPI002A81EB84|nr:hypothetical protein [Eisenbergiella porci]